MADQTAPPADLKSRLKASYDAIAPKYNEWTVPHSATRVHYLNQLLDRLPSPESDGDAAAAAVSVLEIGCGHGLPVTQTLLARPNTTVTANDLSSAQIALARRNLASADVARLTLVEGDMLALDLAPASLDAVVGMYSIIHLPRAEQVQMLGQIAAWLKPGGWLLVNFGTIAVDGLQTDNWLGEGAGWMYWSGWGREGSLEKVREAGFEVVVEETTEDAEDADFLWVLAQKRES